MASCFSVCLSCRVDMQRKNVSKTASKCVYSDSCFTCSLSDCAINTVKACTVNMLLYEMENIRKFYSRREDKEKMAGTQETINSQSQLDQNQSADIMFRMRCAIPAIIQSYNSSQNTVEAQPAIRERLVMEDGSIKYINLPLLINVPVVFPSSGAASITFPISKGDECLIIFSDLAIDNFWTSGVIQNPVEVRRHDLSDGIAIPCSLSLTKTKGAGTTTKIKQGNTQVTLSGATTKMSNGKIHISIGKSTMSFMCGTTKMKMSSNNITFSLGDLSFTAMDIYNKLHE